MSQGVFGDIGHTASVIDRLARAVHCLQYAEGLNPAQWEALRFLGCANRYSRTPTGLAEFLVTTKGTASQTLKSLEQRGYVYRTQHGSDRRKSVLELTDSGRALLDRDPLRRIQVAAADLGSELEDAVAVFARLVRNLQEGCGMREVGVCAECGHRAGPCGKLAVDAVCGLTGEPLDSKEIKKICVGFRPS